MSYNWKIELNITKNNTYNFPPYVPNFHFFSYHSSPTLLTHLSTLLNFLQFQQHPSLNHHSLPLLHIQSLQQQPPTQYYLPLHHHQNLHQYSPLLLHHMLSLYYIYWPHFSLLLITWDKWWILVTHIFSNKIPPLKCTLSLLTLFRIWTVSFLFGIPVPED